MSTFDESLGKEEVVRTIRATTNGLQTGDNYASRFVRELGWHGFLWIINERLNALYPADLFEVETFGVLWSSEHGGEDIDPGVRWVTLLRLALKQLDDPL